MSRPVAGHLSLYSASQRVPWSGVRAANEAIAATCEEEVDVVLGRLEAASLHQRYAGYFSYDLGRHFEVLPVRAEPDLPIPLLAFIPVDETTLIPNFREPIPAGRLLRSTFTRESYKQAVQACLDYIAAGDVFQINLSQRLMVEMAAPPAALFRELQRRFPAEFGAFLDFGSFQMLSNSPELFLRVTRLPDGRRKIVNRPIKGTRRNAPGMHEQLLTSEKDKAELAMIVDLQRNDLGRICEIGSVVVTEPRTIEAHPTVLHGVATIEGILRADVALTDILRATFPCGSITGCPKIRAMEIIEELEPVRRGAYCGAIGWIGGGEMELAVAIRTMTMVDGVAYVPVGGGIVADSDPAAEYEETMTKATAMLAALGIRKPE